MLKKKRFLIGGLVIVLALGYLAYTGVSKSATYYYTIGELEQVAGSELGKNVRVSGMVAEGSVEKESQGTLLRFSIVDADGRKSLPVVFSGVAPDTFKVGADIVAEGYLTPDGIFQAKTILAKCPSRYEADGTS